jgi:hypothetical protein
MNLPVEIRDTGMARSARAWYRPPDFALEYCHPQAEPPTEGNLARHIDEQLGIQSSPHFLAIADTLVIQFVGDGQELVRVDAYTNWVHWLKVNRLVFPQLSGTGRIHLRGLADLCKSPGDDRIDLGLTPTYTYSERDRLLQVSFSDALEHTEYYRVSERLVVAIESGNLASVILQDLSIDA